MPRVQVLPEHIANRIAAGEIVERPSSVVRELLDNSVDAGATRVELIVRGGGRSQISVYDDGQGIDPDSILLAFERHATSKVRLLEDLDHIETLGFRGEALPSIASVSDILIESQTRDAEIGTRMRLKAGNIMHVENVALRPGTLVQVNNLFYNVPARRKFLRTPKTEYGHVLDSFLDHAVTHPAIHWIFRDDQRTIHDLPAVDRWISRLAAVFGNTYVKNMLELDAEREEMTLQGYISTPDRLHSTARSQRLYVNGRRIRDRIVTQAVYRGIQEFLTQHGHPAFIIRLDMDPGQVDVNVHPAKSEVRFQNPNDVFDFVMSAVRACVGGSLRHQFNATPRKTWPGSSGPAAGSWHAQAPATAPVPVMDASEPSSSRDMSPGSSAGTQPAMIQAQEWRVIGQFAHLFILAEFRDQLLFIDQHTAHERILFEDFRVKYQARNIPSQKLLFPAPVELNPRQFSALEEFASILEDMGMHIEPFGRQSFLVRAVPEHLGYESPDLLLQNIADELEEVGHSDRNRAAERLMLITLSCRKAIKAGDPMKPAEMEHLLEELIRFNLPATCPHGRPIIIRMDRQEIERRFKR